MLVRLRLGKRKEIGLRRYRGVALGLASLLTPSALAAFTMAFWSIASDLRWTGNFVISSGLLSHWQIWLAAAAILLVFARLLNRYGGGDHGFGGGDRQALL